MRKIIYSMMVSLDGFIAGPGGELEWAMPDRELHEYVNEQERSFDTHLYGRRTWEVMAGYWPTAEANPDIPDFEREYSRLWKQLLKIVFSRTLEKVEGNAMLLREVNAEEIRRMKEQPGKDMAVAGSDLASTFMRLGLVDECHLYTHPVAIGAGVPMFRDLGQPLKLRLVQQRSFRSGVLHLSYAVER